MRRSSARNSTLPRPCAAASARASSSLVASISTPSTEPRAPTRRASSTVTSPPPQPASRQRSPGPMASRSKSSAVLSCSVRASRRSRSRPAIPPWSAYVCMAILLWMHGGGNPWLLDRRPRERCYLAGSTATFGARPDSVVASVCWPTVGDRRADAGSKEQQAGARNDHTDSSRCVVRWSVARQYGRAMPVTHLSNSGARPCRSMGIIETFIDGELDSCGTTAFCRRSAR